MNRFPGGRWVRGIRIVPGCFAGLSLLGAGLSAASPARAEAALVEIKKLTDKTPDGRRWELGELRVGDTRFLRVPLGIPGGQSFQVKEIETSCGCLQVLGYPESADGTAEISLRYVALKEGSFLVRALVETDLPTEPVLEFAVRVEVVAGDRERAIMIESIAPELLSHRDATIPHGLLISGSEARALSEHGALMVDIRTPAERGGRGVATALEVPLHQLKWKPFLTAQPVILLGSPVLSTATLAAIAKLPRGEKGRIYYLDGGLSAWAAAGGSVGSNGPAAELVRDRVITASELHAAANRNRYLIVDLSGDELSSIYLPEAVRLANPPKNSAAMKDALARLQAEAPDRVLLIVTKDGPAQTQAAAALSTMPVWFLDGGFTGYRQFLGAQTESWRSRRDGRHVVQARQGAVTSHFPRERLSGGCGSCPGR